MLQLLNVNYNNIIHHIAISSQNLNTLFNTVSLWDLMPLQHCPDININLHDVIYQSNLSQITLLLFAKYL